MTPKVTIIGGGLAGCEAAWQLARRGLSVDLFEMRPIRGTPVHQTDHLAELVCSNSLRGNSLDQAAGLLKEEMRTMSESILRISSFSRPAAWSRELPRRMDSLIVRVADEVKVPAG